MTQQEQEKQLKKQYDLFTVRLNKIVRNSGTDLAEFDCEICKAKTGFEAFTAFMYPDYSIKALCNSCGKKEYIRLDYGNKN